MQKKHKKENMEIKKIFLSCTILKQNLYFISEAEHILMRMNVLNRKIEYLDNPTTYNTNDSATWNSADQMISFGGNIYILESNGRRLIEYFLAENKCRYFDIECDGYVCSNYAAFTIYRDKAYIFPSFLNELVTVDLKSGEVIHKRNLCADIFFMTNNKECIPTKLFVCGCRIENIEWTFMQRNNEVLEYSLETEHFQRHKIPDIIHGCVHVEWKDNLFYILDLDGKLYTWDVQTNDIEEWLSEEGNQYPKYREMVITDEKIWILPNTGNDILFIDKRTKEIEKYLEYPEDFCYGAPDYFSKYYVHCEDGDHYYFSMHSGNYIFSVEKKSGKERWISPIFPEIEQIFGFYEKNNICMSEWGCSLSDYIKNAKQKNGLLSGQVSGTGEQIWKRMNRYESM